MVFCTAVTHASGMPIHTVSNVFRAITVNDCVLALRMATTGRSTHGGRSELTEGLRNRYRLIDSRPGPLHQLLPQTSDAQQHGRPIALCSLRTPYIPSS